MTSETRAFYIKLGGGGAWADWSFLTGTIQFGFENI